MSKHFTTNLFLVIDDLSASSQSQQGRRNFLGTVGNCHGDRGLLSSLRSVECRLWGDIPSLCSFEWKLCLQESGATTFSQVDCRDKYCRSACDARLSSLCIKAFYAAIIQADSSEALSAALRAVNLEEMTGKPDTQYLLASPAFISENMKQLVAAGYRPLVETPTGDGYLRSLWYRP